MEQPTAPRRDLEGVERHHLEGLPAVRVKRLLEVGCGAGRLTRTLADFARTVFGFDPDFERLSQAIHDRPRSQTGRTHFLLSMAEHLPFADRSFDSVIFSWSL